MPNFSFLQSKPNYALFAPACIEAEKIYASAPGSVKYFSQNGLQTLG